MMGVAREVTTRFQRRDKKQGLPSIVDDWQ